MEAILSPLKTKNMKTIYAFFLIATVLFFASCNQEVEIVADTITLADFGIVDFRIIQRLVFLVHWFFVNAVAVFGVVLNFDS